MVPPIRPFRPSQAAAPHGESHDDAAALTRGLDRGEFRLAYQPKLDVRRGEVTSLEALIRWQHPEQGLRMPDSFIAQSELSGSISRLTLWTIDQAIADQHDLRTVGRDLSIYVNLSAQLLNDDAMVRALTERASRAGVRLGIEITERSVIDDPETAFSNISRLREAGFAISIDDYGTGLSSLTYLKQIAADELKIDKSFITAIDTSHRDPLIVRSTIDLAHALGMVVTAEGVESPAAYALLSVMGCDLVQGYLVGRAMMPSELIAFLAQFDARHIAVPADGRVLRDARFWKRA